MASAKQIAARQRFAAMVHSRMSGKETMGAAPNEADEDPAEEATESAAQEAAEQATETPPTKKPAFFGKKKAGKHHKAKHGKFGTGKVVAKSSAAPSPFSFANIAARQKGAANGGSSFGQGGF